MGCKRPLFCYLNEPLDEGMESKVCGPKASFLGSVLVWEGCPTCWPTPPQGGTLMEGARYLPCLPAVIVALTLPIPWLGTFDLVLMSSIGPYCHCDSLLLYFENGEFLEYFCFTETVRDPASLLLLTFKSWGPRSICLPPTISQVLPWFTYAVFSGFIITVKWRS